MAVSAATTLAGSTTVRLRLSAAFIYRFVSTMIVPFMAIYLVANLGAVTGGLLMVLVAATSAAATVLGGPLCDRIGRRPMLILGEFGAGAGFLGTGIAALPHVAAPTAGFACFITATTLSALTLPAHDATIVDVTTPVNRKSYYAVNYWSINVAIGVGSLLGGFLYANHFPEVLLSCGLVLVLLGVVTTAVLAESRPAAAAVQRRAGLAAGYRVVLTDRRFGLLLVAATLAISVELQLTSYIAVRLAAQLPRQPLVPAARSGGQVSGPQMVGVLRLENTVLVVLLALVLVRVLRRIPDRLRLVGGLSIFTAGFMVLAVSNVAWLLLVAMAVLTVGELANVPIKQALIANAAREAARGSYLAAYGMTGNLGWVIATACIALGAALRPWEMALLIAVCGASAASIFAWYRPDQTGANRTGTPPATLDRSAA